MYPTWRLDFITQATKGFAPVRTSLTHQANGWMSGWCVNKSGYRDIKQIHRSAKEEQQQPSYRQEQLRNGCLLEIIFVPDLQSYDNNETEFLVPCGRCSCGIF